MPCTHGFRHREGMPLRQLVKDFVGLCITALPFKAAVYESSALQVEDLAGFADMRGYFEGMEYVGFDYREGPGVGVKGRALDGHLSSLPEALGAWKRRWVDGKGRTSLRRWIAWYGGRE